MGKIMHILFWGLFPLIAIAQNKRPASSQTLAITHVTVIDVMGGPVKPDMTVIVSGNRITSVQNKRTAKVPKGAIVVDARGKFLLPGLWDMHVHMLQQQGFNTKNFLPLFIANGITGVREMGNSPLSVPQVQLLRTKIESGEQIGPRMLVAGPLVDGRLSGWKSKVVVTTEQQGRNVVDSLKKAGVDFVKVYGWLSPAVYFAIANEAKKQGISFVGHVPESVTAVEASNAGQKSFEHLYEILLACSSQEEQLRQQRNKLSTLQLGSPEWLNTWNTYNHLLQDSYSEERARNLFTLFRKNNTWHCPTLVAQYAGTHFEEVSQTHQNRLKYLDTAIKQFWTERTEFRKKHFMLVSKALLEKQHQKELDLVGAMHKAGVSILAGSDNLNPYVYPGFSLHDELGLLVKAGLSPLEALQAATINPAKFFGQTASLGMVGEGKLADLLLLEANPLEDIINTKKIAAVIANGRYYSKATLKKMLLTAEESTGQK